MKDGTKSVAAGRRPFDNHGVVNPPVYHASTILSPTLADYQAARRIRSGDGVTYGVHGTPGTFALEEAICALEAGSVEGCRTRLCETGLTACTAPLLAYLGAGDHVLVTDSVYGPTRRFCEGMLKRFGVETTYYDPLIGAGIRDLFRANTRAVFLESPGSWTFEVQDVPAIAAEAKRIGAWTLMDNTWASPLYFKPFEHGVDVSIQAVTKYISGHSDLVLGAVTATAEAYPALQKGWEQLGLSGAPDDVFLAMRGIRTIAPRLRQHFASGMELAHWLAAQPEVAEVMHPALPSDPGHEIWRRDFLGASSLFGFVLKPEVGSSAHLSALLDHLAHFGMGASWGGFESLLIPVDPRPIRVASPWPRPGRPEGQVMRIHVGLEDPADLIADLSAGFERLRRV